MGQDEIRDAPTTGPERSRPALQDDDQIGATIWRGIEPRSPTSQERALLDALISATGSDELAEQARTVQITGACTCGCPSVRLQTPARSLTSEMIALLVAGHGPDHFAITGTSPGNVQVIAHILDGRLGELEIYAGPGTAVDLRRLSPFTDVEITG